MSVLVSVPVGMCLQSDLESEWEGIVDYADWDFGSALEFERLGFRGPRLRALELDEGMVLEGVYGLGDASELEGDPGSRWNRYWYWCW